MGEVENISNSSNDGLSIEVKKMDVPLAFDSLMLTVVNKVGEFISYVHTSSPSKITISVPNRIVFQLPVISHKNYRPTKYDIPSITSNDLQVEVRKHLIINCLHDTVEIALTRSISDPISGLLLTLNDSYCSAEKNSTHLFIRSRYSECGFIRHENFYNNYVRVKLGTGPGFSDDEDLEGSGYEFGTDYLSEVKPISFSCLISSLESQGNFSNTKLNLAAKGDIDVSYNMKIYYDDSMKDIRPMSKISLGKWIHVSAGLDRVSDKLTEYDIDLRVILEKCWLSNSSFPQDIDGIQHMLMVKSCPVRQQVKADERSFSAPEFYFQVSIFTLM